MLFNSLDYCIFLPIVFAIYWILSDKYRWIVLLVASYYFYMYSEPKYVILLMSITILSYIFAIIISFYKGNHKTASIILIISIIVILSILVYYKYINFFCKIFFDFVKVFTKASYYSFPKLILPVGISFYTFQAMSYVIDVYKGNAVVEFNFLKYATFISFFPQLVAGPIERSNNLLIQINKAHSFNCNQSIYGLKLMIWGYYKKLLIADALSPYVKLIYECPQNYYGFSLLLATLFFTIQIYCDFSGYSDIAIGTAKLFGFDLITNFKSPYFSESVKEFWNRWHISLSTWFRDYIYIPLGGNRVNKFRNYFNLLFTFILSGLWHGANYTFVVWGGIHGVALILEKNIMNSKCHFPVISNKLFRIITVFIFTVFAWIFFVSKSISDSLHVVANFTKGISNPISYFRLGFKDLGMNRYEFLIIFSFILLLAIYDFISKKCDFIVLMSKKRILQFVFYVIITVIIVFLSKKGVATDFIYFSF